MKIPTVCRNRMHIINIWILKATSVGAGFTECGDSAVLTGYGKPSPES